MSRLTTSQDLIQTHLPVSPAGLAKPQLPDWVMSIPGVRRIVARMGATEFRRRLFHMSPALLPIGLPFIPHPDIWGPILVGLCVASSAIALTIAIAFGHLLMRRGEENWMHAVLGYLAPVLAGLLLLPGRAEFGLMTLQIIALGDGSATFGGLMLGGRRLPWNRKKTWSGLFCFAIIGTMAATYMYWGESRPTVPFATSFLICGTAALCAAIVESIPIRSNDNFRVGTTALVVGLAMSAVLV